VAISELEEYFERRWDACYPNLPLSREQKLIPNKGYRFDFTHVEARVTVEINGGNYTKARSGHSSSAGLRRDYEKYNLAQLVGYDVFILDTEMIKVEDWYHLIADKILQNLET
jgi:very-short-patch-repair endonuclease